jgi:hypothetical protein
VKPAAFIATTQSPAIHVLVPYLIIFLPLLCD